MSNENEKAIDLVALKKAVDYVSKLLTHKEFDTEEHYLWSCGYADGLSDAIAILNGVDWKELVKDERSLTNE